MVSLVMEMKQYYTKYITELYSSNIINSPHKHKQLAPTIPSEIII